MCDNEKKYWDLQDRIHEIEQGRLYLADPCYDMENVDMDPPSLSSERYWDDMDEYWGRMIRAAQAAYQNRAEEYIAHRGEKIPVEIYDLI